MNIGLYNLEPNIVNTAMMQVSSYHKSIGDKVSLYNKLKHKDYDKIYAFSIFSFTDKGYVTKDMICGGTGFNLTTKLSKQIEDCDYDWTLYPDCDYSIIWFSRGCIRDCKFCVVQQKEGMIHSVKPKNLNPNGKHIKVLDNNFFANPDWKQATQQLNEWNQPIDLQGIDIRILNKENIEALNLLKHKKLIKCAWDNPKENLIPKFESVIKNGLKPYKLMCYVLIGFDSTEEQDLYRVEQLRKIKINPFVMSFNKNDRYQKNFARWVNHKAIFKTVKWEDYKKRIYNDGLKQSKLI